MQVIYLNIKRLLNQISGKVQQFDINKEQSNIQKLNLTRYLEYSFLLGLWISFVLLFVSLTSTSHMFHYYFFA